MVGKRKGICTRAWCWGRGFDNHKKNVSKNQRMAANLYFHSSPINVNTYTQFCAVLLPVHFIWMSAICSDEFVYPCIHNALPNGRLLMHIPRMPNATREDVQNVRHPISNRHPGPVHARAGIDTPQLLHTHTHIIRSQWLRPSYNQMPLNIVEANACTHPRPPPPPGTGIIWKTLNSHILLKTEKRKTVKMRWHRKIGIE